MKTVSRRDFVKVAGTAATLAAMPAILRGQASGPRVVVVGGGFGGGTAAKYLRLWGPDLQVTLVEPNPAYVSCVLSNLLYADRVQLGDLTTSYNGLRGHGVTVLQDRATAIDPVGHRVTLAGGSRLDYDKLVVAPGIDFLYPQGLTTPQAQALIPHAWKDIATQGPLLRSQLRAMPNGGTFVVTVPTPPYRCPPGPYERVCMAAAYFKRDKRRSRVVVLDANPGILAEVDTFTRAFNETYRGFVDYRPGSPVLEVDAATRTVTTPLGRVRGDVLNVIPLQQAGRIAFDAGLVNFSGRWAGVDVQTFASTAAQDVYVVGDSHGSTVGKAGHFANSEAKICAAAIIAQLTGEPVNAAPTLGNACYSGITPESASFFTTTLTYQNGAMVAVPEGTGSGRPSGGNYQDMFGWARNLWADSLGLNPGASPGRCSATPVSNRVRLSRTNGVVRRGPVPRVKEG